MSVLFRVMLMFGCIRCSLTYATTADTLFQENDLLTVRVVIHVVYQDEHQNISDEQIRSQLQVLNQDFQRRNPNASQTLPQFQPLAANTQISFVLAREDPERNFTNGITRTATAHGPFANRDIHESRQGGQDAWDPSRYFNIWVCALAPGTLGYTVTPNDSTGNDGVVIHYENFGTRGTAQPPYHWGRTLTHEAGHWLGLDHPWGKRGGCDDDDGIDDTPLQTGAHPTPDLATSSCGSLDMVQNFMNLAPDSSLTLFTHQQASRMRHVLQQQRSGVLYSDYVLAAADPLPNTHLQVYPDAAQPGFFHVLIPTRFTYTHLSVSNSAGQWLQKIHIRTHRVIDLSSYPTGTYLFRVDTPEGSQFRRVIHPAHSY